MARAYATIATGGWRVQADRDHEGRLPRRARSTRRSASRSRDQGLHRRRRPPRRRKILEANVQRGTGTAAQIGCPAAGKTGTTDDFTDAWFVGFTPTLSTAVWVGYPEARASMTAVAGYGAMFGGTAPAPIWGDYMKTAIKNASCGDVPRAQGAVRAGAVLRRVRDDRRARAASPTDPP